MSDLPFRDVPGILRDLAHALDALAEEQPPAEEERAQETLNELISEIELQGWVVPAFIGGKPDMRIHRDTCCCIECMHPNEGEEQ
jgi:hypothetical protein